MNPNYPDFEKGNGLLPVVVQEATTQQVLMLAYMNEAAYRQTLACGEMVYYSRSRNSLWHKGESSGHVQRLRELRIDCDNDTLLALVHQTGSACHTGHKSCFFRTVDANGAFSPADGASVTAD